MAHQPTTTSAKASAPSPARTTYRVWSDCISRCYQEVSAASPQQAYRLAENNRDGWEFCSDAGDNSYRLADEVRDVHTGECIDVRTMGNPWPRRKAPAHSGGEWFFDPVELIISDGPEKTSNALAVVEQREEPSDDYDETSANGWVMAAAPNLLEACEDALTTLRSLAGHPVFADDAFEFNRGGFAYESCERLESVIAKAKGKQA